jgi:hypothetical protein
VFYVGQGGGGGGRVAVHLTNENFAFNGDIQAFGGASGVNSQPGSPGESTYYFWVLLFGPMMYIIN